MGKSKSLKPIYKTFKISRLSYIADCYDDGITEGEIEKILNDSNKTHRTPMSEGLWRVKEVKRRIYGKKKKRRTQKRK